jgi:hypothetical protein
MAALSHIILFTDMNYILYIVHNIRYISEVVRVKVECGTGSSDVVQNGESMILLQDFN